VLLFLFCTECNNITTTTTTSSHKKNTRGMPRKHQDPFELEIGLPCPKHMRRSRGKNTKNLCVPICFADEHYSPKHKMCLPYKTSRPLSKARQRAFREWSVGDHGKRQYVRPEWMKRCGPNSHRSPTDPRYCIKGKSPPRVSVPMEYTTMNTPQGRAAYPRPPGKRCQRHSRSSKDKKWCYKIHMRYTDEYTDKMKARQAERQALRQTSKQASGKTARKVIGALENATGMPATPANVQNNLKVVQQTVNKLNSKKRSSSSSNIPTDRALAMTEEVARVVENTTGVPATPARMKKALNETKKRANRELAALAGAQRSPSKGSSSINGRIFRIRKSSSIQ